MEIDESAIGREDIWYFKKMLVGRSEATSRIMSDEFKSVGWLLMLENFIDK